MTSQEALKAFAEAKGFPGLAFDADGVAAFDIAADEAVLQIVLEADMGERRIGAVVRLGALDGDGFEFTLAGLMAVNAAHYPLNRGVFALAGDDGEAIVLMRLFDVQGLDEGEFLLGMEEFMDDAVEWRRRLCRPDLGIDDDDDEIDRPSDAGLAPGGGALRA